MAQITYSIRVTLESIEVLDDEDLRSAGEIYVLANIDGHSTGRSRIFTANSGDTITLTGTQWTHEVLIRGRTSVPMTVQVWDEDQVIDDMLGSLTINIASPFTARQTTTTDPGGAFRLTWSVAQTVVTADRAGVGQVSRQHDGSSYVSTLASPRVAVVVLREIRGLYRPGVDDRPAPIAPGTTKNSGYEAGYISGDNQGRIFRNRALDGSWHKDHQQIEITAEIIPAAAVLTAGCKIHWTIEDPDDPTNEGPTVHAEAGIILDPNDYSGGVKTAAAHSDNNPNGAATATARLEQIDPMYALAGSDTLVDIPTRTSKVRFHTSDICGDNYRIKAEVVNLPGFDLLVHDQTGVMTVWDRVELEYVRMASAVELPVDQIAAHYDMARVQVDVSIKRIATGASDLAAMGATEGAADAACESYATAATGEFTREGTPGWFFIAAANRFMPFVAATLLYQGDAECLGDRVRLFAPGVMPAGSIPAVVRIFAPARVAALAGTWPNDRTMHFKFATVSITGRIITLEPHDFNPPDNPNAPFLLADLSHYGFATGSTLKVQVMSEGDEALVTTGISPTNTIIGGQLYFEGKLLVFTRSLTAPELIDTLTHELCHAFDNAHKCGNWDWRAQASRTACCMNYWFQFVLDNATPRAPIRWTQNRISPRLCAAHLRRMRDYHLEDNPGLGW